MPLLQQQGEFRQSIGRSLGQRGSGRLEDERDRSATRRGASGSQDRYSGSRGGVGRYQREGFLRDSRQDPDWDLLAAKRLGSNSANSSNSNPGRRSSSSTGVSSAVADDGINQSATNSGGGGEEDDCVLLSAEPCQERPEGDAAHSSTAHACLVTPAVDGGDKGPLLASLDSSSGSPPSECPASAVVVNCAAPGSVANPEGTRQTGSVAAQAACEAGMPVTLVAEGAVGHQPLMAPPGPLLHSAPTAAHNTQGIYYNNQAQLHHQHACQPSYQQQPPLPPLLGHPEDRLVSAAGPPLPPSAHHAASRQQQQQLATAPVPQGMPPFPPNSAMAAKGGAAQPYPPSAHIQAGCTTVAGGPNSSTSSSGSNTGCATAVVGMARGSCSSVATEPNVHAPGRARSTGRVGGGGGEGKRGASGSRSGDSSRPAAPDRDTRDKFLSGSRNGEGARGGETTGPAEARGRERTKQREEVEQKEETKREVADTWDEDDDGFGGQAAMVAVSDMKSVVVAAPLAASPAVPCASDGQAYNSPEHPGKDKRRESGEKPEGSTEKNEINHYGKLETGLEVGAGPPRDAASDNTTSLGRRAKRKQSLQTLQAEPPHHTTTKVEALAKPSDKSTTEADEAQSRISPSLSPSTSDPSPSTSISTTASSPPPPPTASSNSSQAAVAGQLRSPGSSRAPPVGSSRSPSPSQLPAAASAPNASGSSPLLLANFPPPSAAAAAPWRGRTQQLASANTSERLEREVKSLLNKLTIEKFTTIVEKLAVLAEGLCADRDQISVFVSLVLRKAVSEPDWSEMYADLCQVLKWRTSALAKAPPTAAGGGGGPSTSNPPASRVQSIFTVELINQAGEEFQRLPRTLVLPPEETEGLNSEEIAAKSKKLQNRVLGVVKLIGELFYRKMLSPKILGHVASTLVFGEEHPDEHFVQCLCSLAFTVGYYLDENGGAYKAMLETWMGRLAELQKHKQYSKHLFCVIQDVLDCRKAGWLKKIHKDRAKALGDLREQLGREEDAGGSVIAAQFGNIVVVGSRANIEANGSYAQYMKEQEDLYASRVTTVQQQAK